MNTQIYAARLMLPPHPSVPNDPGLYWFASIDGDLWVEVTDDPRHCTTVHVRQLLGLHPSEDRAVRYPLKIHRSFLRAQGAVFLTGEKHAQ